MGTKGDTISLQMEIINEAATYIARKHCGWVAIDRDVICWKQGTLGLVYNAEHLTVLSCLNNTMLCKCLLKHIWLKILTITIAIISSNCGTWYDLRISLNI